MLPLRPGGPAAAVLRIAGLGLLVGLAVPFLLPARLEAADLSRGAALAVTALGVLTVMIAAYPLLAVGPAEPAVFRPQTAIDIATMLRPGYAVGLIAIDFVIAGGADQADPTATTTCTAVFATLPLLWAIGLLPPLDALVAWAAEQALVLGLGGSPMASDLRLWWMSVLSWGGGYVVTWLLLEHSTRYVIRSPGDRQSVMYLFLQSPFGLCRSCQK